MAKTKKVGSAGRFKARYGRRLRQKITDVEKKQRKKQVCPYCKKINVRRLAYGIWLCKTCNTKFTGKAYYLE